VALVSGTQYPVLTRIIITSLCGHTMSNQGHRGSMIDHEVSRSGTRIKQCQNNNNYCYLVLGQRNLALDFIQNAIKPSGLATSTISLLTHFTPSTQIIMRSAWDSIIEHPDFDYSRSSSPAPVAAPSSGVNPSGFPLSSLGSAFTTVVDCFRFLLS
jgi:hypothetical protein